MSEDPGDSQVIAHLRDPPAGLKIDPEFASNLAENEAKLANDTAAS